MKNTIIPSWKNQGYFEIQYKNWHFAVVVHIDIFGNNIAIVQDCCHNKDYHNDMMLTQPFEESIPMLKDRIASKFTDGIQRMYHDGEINSHDMELKMNDIIRYIVENGYTQEYDQNFNNLSIQSLIHRFVIKQCELMDLERVTIESANYSINESYIILPIDSFEKAQSYNHFTDWCTGTSYPSFIGNTENGLISFYYCLKKDFEKMKKEEGDHFPFDEYGLSMIAVSININGLLNSCTLRWNHDNNIYNDYAMNALQLSKLLGVNFYSVFKPFNIKV